LEARTFERDLVDNDPVPLISRVDIDSVLGLLDEQGLEVLYEEFPGVGT
jgi:hypothetical protein